MIRKRFAIDPSGLDLDGEEDPDVAEAGQDGGRLGPMATAIRESKTAAEGYETLAAQADMVAMKLAVQMKKLHDAKLDLQLIDLDAIDEGHLRRDRASIDIEGLEELKTSIAANGLSQPIRVDDTGDGRYGLNQGRRRLHAFRALLEETGDARYARIPALVDSPGERAAAYRRMVDENLIREDVSYAELALLAMEFAEEAGITTDEAVSQLYASVSKQKRTHIRSFVQVLEVAGAVLRFPAAIPRNVGLELAGRLKEPAAAAAFVRALSQAESGSPEAERAAIEAALAPQKRKEHPGRRPDITRFQMLFGGAQKRRVDVAVSDGKLVISGFRSEEVDLVAVRAFVSALAERD